MLGSETEFIVVGVGDFLNDLVEFFFQFQHDIGTFYILFAGVGQDKFFSRSYKQLYAEIFLQVADVKT